MKSRQARSLLALAFAIPGYLACAILAYLRYPPPYSPVRNWLSDLGDLDRNPAGARFYNAGVVAIGVALLPFFVGLGQWQTGERRGQVIMLRVTQGFGLVGALALILSGLFPINIAAAHSFFSACLNFSLGTAFGFSVAALRYHPRCPRWLLALGGATALVAMIYGLLRTVQVLEWVTVALFLGYVGLLAVQTARIAPPAATPAEGRARVPAAETGAHHCKARRAAAPPAAIHTPLRTQPGRQRDQSR